MAPWNDPTRDASTEKAGLIGPLPGDASKYLDGTGQFTAPPNGGGAGVGSVAAADASVVVGGTPDAPTIKTATLDVIATTHPPAVDVPMNSKKITGLADGVVPSDAATVNQIPTHLPPNGSASGDLTGVYPNPSLVTTGVTAATYGDGTHVPQVAVDAKGRVTSASNVAITGAAPTGSAGGDLTGTFPNPSIGTSTVTVAKVVPEVAARLKVGGKHVYRRGILDETTPGQVVDSTGFWSGTNSYDVVNSGIIATIKAAGGIPVVYKSLHQINKAAGTGVAYAEYDSFSWPLNTAAGKQSLDAFISLGPGTIDETVYLHHGGSSAANRITNDQGYHVGNLRNEGYCKFVGQSLVNFARNYGFEYYFLDNFGDNVSPLTIVSGSSVMPDEYQSDDEWEFAALQGYWHILTRLSQAGIKVILNAGGNLNNSSGGIHTNESLARLDTRSRWYQQLARIPGVYGFAHEYYMQDNNSVAIDDDIFTGVGATHGAASWGSYMFRGQMLAQQLGKAHFGVVYGANAPNTPGSDQNLRLARGIDLLLWDGVTPGGILNFNNSSGATTDTSPTYKWDAGVPTSAHQRIGGASSPLFVRDYQKADGTAVQVKVNLDGTNSHTINGTTVASRDAVVV